MAGGNSLEGETCSEVLKFDGDDDKAFLHLHILSELPAYSPFSYLSLISLRGSFCDCP